MKSFSIFYKEVEGNEKSKCMYPTRLDTYGCGCQHDCKYCYAKSQNSKSEGIDKHRKVRNECYTGRFMYKTK